MIEAARYCGLNRNAALYSASAAAVSLRRAKKLPNVVRASGRSALARCASTNSAAAHHALGLTLTRLKEPDAALAEFQKAAELEPDSARYIYVYAVALNSGGQGDSAIKVLMDGLARHHPGDRDILSALIAFNRTSGDLRSALAYAERLATITPDDRNLAALIEQLRGALPK